MKLVASPFFPSDENGELDSAQLEDLLLELSRPAGENSEAIETVHEFSKSRRLRFHSIDRIQLFRLLSKVDPSRKKDIELALRALKNFESREDLRSCFSDSELLAQLIF